MADDGAHRQRVRVRRRLTEDEIRERRRRRRIRRALQAAGVLAVAAVLLGLWIVFTGLNARHNLDAARADLIHARTALENGDVPAARRAVSAAAEHTGSAHRRTDDVLWRAADAIPFFGDPVATVRGLSKQADVLATDTLPTALRAGSAFDPREARPQPDRINLSVLVSARQPLAAASASATLVRRRVAALPSVGYVGPVAHARKQFLEQADELQQLLGRAHTAAVLGPSMLGLTEPRRYFLVFQTNAEARGTGGLPGAFAIITADRGHIAVEHVGSDVELHSLRPARVPLGTGYDKVFGQFSTNELWVNSNISPEFPDVAKLWYAYFHKLRPNQRVDGAIATDPIALSHVLAALGPVRLPSGEIVTADRVVQLLESDVYARFGDDAHRKAYLVDVASTVLHHLLTSARNPARLLTGITRAVEERRVLIASTRSDEEQMLSRTGVGGSVAVQRGPAAYLVVNNAAGNKMDFYLKRSLTYQAGGCGSDARTSMVRIRLSNAAPPSGLPRIVDSRVDLPRGTAYRPGSDRSLLFLYLTAGAQYDGGTIDGEPLLVSAADSYGHRVLTMDVVTDPGQTHDLVLRLREPTVPGRAWVPRQPLIDPMPIQARVPTCG